MGMGDFSAFVFCGVIVITGVRAGAENYTPRGQPISDVVAYTQSPKIAVASGAKASYVPRPQSKIALLMEGAHVELLTPNFDTAARPRVSSDASRILFVGREDRSRHLSVWEMRSDGAEQREIIGCDGDCIQAEYLSTLYTLDDPAPSHRIAFVCQPKAASPAVIFTSRVDGSDRRQITFTPLGVVNPTPLPDGRLAFCLSDLPRAVRENSGLAEQFIVHVDGTDLRAYAPPSSFLGPETVSEPAFTDSVKSGEAPFARRRLSDGRMLESVFLDGTKSMGVVALDPHGGPRDIFYDSVEWDETDPVVVAPYRDHAGHSSVVRDSAGASLYCLDSTITEFNSPLNRKVQRVRVLEAQTQGDGVSERMLGEVSVEDDGSFFLEVPARTPIRLELVGQDGEVVRGMKSWTWLMPGERRGCIGCHEDPKLSPPNRHVLALRKPAQKLRLPERADRFLNPATQTQQRTEP